MARWQPARSGVQATRAWQLLVMGSVVLILSISVLAGSFEQRRSTILLGTAVSRSALDAPAYREALHTHFTLVTTENELKFDQVQPEQGRFDFTAADAIVEFAREHGQQVRGHTLISHAQLPAWLNEGEFTRTQLIKIMEEHITTTISRYRGRIAMWDVVNEPLNSDGTLRESLWLRTIGPEYIEIALRSARQADPSAFLYINEYGTEIEGLKSDGYLRLAYTLLSHAVPLDGVGFQMHLTLEESPNPSALKQIMKQFAALKLRIDITEMDVQLQRGVGTHAERLAAQANMYREIARICVEEPACMVFSVWGVNDAHSWIPEHTGNPDSPLLLDEAYQPKPAFDAVMRVFGRVISPLSSISIHPDTTN